MCISWSHFITAQLVLRANTFSLFFSHLVLGLPRLIERIFFPALDINAHQGSITDLQCLRFLVKKLYFKFKCQSFTQNHSQVVLFLLLTQSLPMMGFPFRFAINVFRGLAWLPVLHRPSQHLPIDWPDWYPALFPGLTRSSTYLAWTDSVIDLFRLDLVMDLLWSDPSLTYFCLDWLVINLLCLDWLGHQLILPGASPLSVDFRALRESLTLS